MSLDDYPKEAKLKGGRTVTIRLLAGDDFERLFAFFRGLPEEDRTFLRHDVTDPDVIRRWTQELDFEHVIPLVAVDNDQIVADGTLHITTHGWMQHVAHLRMVTARTHRHMGLATVVAREIVALAEERGLEKLQAHCIEQNLGAVKMLERVGFELAAVLKGIVKDQAGRTHNLAIMINDVARLGQVMEDWIHDSMLPMFRIPGGGEG